VQFWRRLLAKRGADLAVAFAGLYCIGGTNDSRRTIAAAILATMAKPRFRLLTRRRTSLGASFLHVRQSGETAGPRHGGSACTSIDGSSPALSRRLPERVDIPLFTDVAGTVVE
jgi:hypothetical protein